MHISREKTFADETFETFRGKKLSRMRHFETFRGKKLSRKGPKNAKPRKFLSAKVSDLKVIDEKPWINTLHVIGVITRKNPQLVPNLVIIQADAAGLVASFIPNNKFFGRNFF